MMKNLYQKCSIYNMYDPSGQLGTHQFLKMYLHYGCPLSNVVLVMLGNIPSETDVMKMFVDDLQLCFGVIHKLR